MSVIRGRAGGLWAVISLAALLSAGCNGRGVGDSSPLCGDGFGDSLGAVRSSGAATAAAPLEAPPSTTGGGGRSVGPALDLEANPLGIFGPIFPGLGSDTYTVPCEVYDDGYGNCL